MNEKRDNAADRKEKDDQRKMDEVLRKMLNTPPKKPEKSDKKPDPK